MLHIITLLILSKGYSPNVSIAHCGYTCLHKYVITILSNPVSNKGWKKQASTLFQIKITQQLLCILTSIWVLRASKSWSKHFFQSFPTFFVHVRDFTSQIKKKCLKYKSIFKIFVYSSKLVDMQTLVDSLKGYSVLTTFRVLAAPENSRKNRTEVDMKYLHWSLDIRNVDKFQVDVPFW